MSHKPECPHKVEKKLTPVPTNQFMQEHTHTDTHKHTYALNLEILVPLGYGIMVR